MRRLPVALVAVTAALLGSAGPAHAIADSWQKLPYFHYSLHELYVASDATWTKAKAVGPASPRNINVPSWARDRKTPQIPLWASKCTAAKQKVEFRKQFAAPGEAASASVVIDLLNASTISHPRSVKVALNDTVVASLGKAPVYKVRLTAAQLKLIRAGINTLKITATRPKLPKKGRCNSSKAGAQQIGVSAAFFAQFRTDIGLRPPQPPTYLKAAVGGTRDVQMTINVKNNGPIASLGGGLGIRITAQPLLRMRGVTVASGNPFLECQPKTVLEQNDVVISCPWQDFLPGREHAVVVTAAVAVKGDDEVPASRSTERLDVGLYAYAGTPAWIDGGSLYGPRSNAQSSASYTLDNGTLPPHTTLQNKQESFIYCFREPADDPGCAGAT